MKNQLINIFLSSVVLSIITFAGYAMYLYSSNVEQLVEETEYCFNSNGDHYIVGDERCSI